MRNLTRVFAVRTQKYGSRQMVRPKIRHLAPQCMRIWRMNLRRTKSAIISWAGSFSDDLLSRTTLIHIWLVDTFIHPYQLEESISKFCLIWVCTFQKWDARLLWVKDVYRQILHSCHSLNLAFLRSLLFPCVYKGLSYQNIKIDCYTKH